jgi:phosphoserine phosphatase
MTALHVFDMDGTLLPSTTAGLEISRHLGQLDHLIDLEHRFAAGEITAAGFAVEVRELWADLEPAAVADIAAAAPWIAGISEVCADITARGEASMLITMSPDFFARHLHDHGMQIVHGSRFPPLPFTSAIDPTAVLTPADKVRLTDAECTSRGLTPYDCVAYGDSLSDEPLFAHLPNTVAVNAAPAVEALARVAYRGDDLREAYARGRDLLKHPSSS